ncbi:hypothetical protein B296_00013809, partial [Ensete ventricosum]
GNLMKIFIFETCQVMQSGDSSASEIILSNMAVAFDRILLDVEVVTFKFNYIKLFNLAYIVHVLNNDFVFSFILRTSYIGNLSLFFDMEKKLKQGHNIVLFSNHQTEADPPLIALLLEKTNPYLAEKLVRLVVVSFSVVSVLVVFKCYVLYLRFLWQETGLLPTHFASPSAWAGSCHFF